MCFWRNSFDAASLAILDRLAKIETRLDNLAIPPPISSGQQPQQLHNTSAPFQLGVGGINTTSPSPQQPQQPLSQLPPIQYHPPLPQTFKAGHGILSQQSLPLTPPVQTSVASSANVGGILPPTTSAGSTITSITPDQHHSHFSSTGNDQVAHLPPPRQPQKEKRLSRLAAVGSTCQAVLLWPIFGGAYDPDAILAPLFGDDSDDSDDDESDDNHGGGVRWSRSSEIDVDEKELERYDLRHLIERFLTNVQTKNPILDQGILEEYVDEIERQSFNGSGESCIVVSL